MSESVKKCGEFSRVGLYPSFIAGRAFVVYRRTSFEFAFKDTLVDGLLMSCDSFFSAVLSWLAKLV
jgi:hypothetical protein